MPPKKKVMCTKGEEIAAKLQCRFEGVNEKYWESRVPLVREQPWLAKQIDDAISEASDSAFQRGVWAGQASAH
jgi:hypothetical protein